MLIVVIELSLKIEGNYSFQVPLICTSLFWLGSSFHKFIYVKPSYPNFFCYGVIAGYYQYWYINNTK